MAISSTTDPLQAKSLPTPVPSLLTTPDAMLYAADQLDTRATDLSLMALLLETMGKRKPAPEDPNEVILAEKVAELRHRMSEVLDAQLQEKAMRAAAKVIRAAANEQKLVEARAAARGIGA